jgi:hypothetical protein
MERDRSKKHPLIAVVGPCASGKSLLVQALKKRGYNAREVLQEHSYVRTMWERITQPDVLIYLDVTEKTARQRRRTSAPAGWWDTLAQRLSHAQQHADLYLHTDDMSPQEIVDAVMTLLRSLSL